MKKSVETAPHFSKLPRHVGIIPDGNRRWAREHNLQPITKIYAMMVDTLTRAMLDCKKLGFKEVTVYGASTENMNRPDEERTAFLAMIAKMSQAVIEHGFNLFVIGDTSSPLFPDKLRANLKMINDPNNLKFNFLVNYGWEWDIHTAIENGKLKTSQDKSVQELLGSADVTPVDLLLRWGGTHRLSGFLPVQTVYSEIYVFDKLWPEYDISHFHEALSWYEKQEIKHGL